MLHQPAEWVLPCLISGVYVADDLGKGLVRHLHDEIHLFRLDLSPPGPDGSQIRKFRHLKQGAGRNPFPTPQPDPFGSHDMNQRVSDAWKAATEMLRQFLCTERRNRLQDG